MIDLHCHILPGIDDGPRTLDDALGLARAAVAAGTTTVVATPHVNHAFPDNDAVGIIAAVEDLNGEIQRAGIALEVRTGAEVALTRGLELSDSELARLRLGGGEYLLVECPHMPSTAGLESALSTLQSRGHRILLAHVERIPGFQADIGIVEALVDRGMLVQVTAAAIGGRYGKPVRQFAEQLLRAGLVHNIASDAHSAERRGPGIVPHLEAAGWTNHLEYATLSVPHALLDGRALPASPVLPRRRRRLFQRG